MTVLGFRRAVILGAGALITLTIGACDGSSGSSPRPTAATNQATTDASTSENNGDNNSNTGGNSNTTDGGSQTSEPAEIISESRALSIMGGSCLAANCHATAEQLLNMPTTLERLEDRSMPPTNQSRYTLRDDRRQSLIAFFIDRSN